MNGYRIGFLVFLSVLTGSVAIAVGSDWPNWRGPFLNGSSETANLPDTLAPDQAAWSVDLPGPAGSTPVVLNGKLFLTSTEKGSGNLVGLCLDAADGSILWQKKLTSSDERFPRNTLASPSPVADAKHVYFLFGNGEWVCLEQDGKEVWRRNLVVEFGSLSVKFGYSSSPLLLDKTLYLPVIRRQTVYRGPASEKPLASFLLAVEARTGKTVFYQERPSDAVDETTNSYLTPVAAVVNGTQQIVLFGADYLTTHDPKTGHESMRFQYDTSKDPIGRNISSPLADGQRVYAVLPRGVACVSFDLANTDAPLLWRSEASGPDSSTPVLYKGSLYMIEDRGKMLVCIDPATGTSRWKGQLNKSGLYFAAITAADDKLYTVNEAGVVSVVAADPNEFRLLSTTPFRQAPIQSTIVPAAGRLYLRTAEKLYCFQKPSH